MPKYTTGSEDSAISQAEELSGVIQDLIDTIERLDEEPEAANDTIAELESDKEDLESDKEDLENQIINLKDEIDTLDRLV